MEFIKKIIPEALLKAVRPFYHGAMAYIASWYFGNPSREMIVIGVTGTAGKSTTVQMLSRILNHASKKTGFITTVSFFDGETEFINKHGLSMPGGWLLQKQLKTMLSKGCGWAIVECTSEGLAQNRHLGINLSMAVFTNLSEAHVEAHGGFTNYRKAKGKLFSALQKSLILNPKSIIVNGDDENAEYFLSFRADRKIAVGFNQIEANEDLEVLQAQRTEVGFNLQATQFEIKLVGKFNHYNALLASAAANALGVSITDCASALSSFTKIRGRMEPVENNRGISIFVDYGCEPATFKAALLAVKELSHTRIIHVFGSTGGHRDKQKRFIFGETSAKFADYIIVTNDDIYDSDPEEIAANIVAGIKKYEVRSKSYEIILDRRQAIHHALKMAQPGDIVLFTGKSSEQFLSLPGNKRIAWDEVEVVKQELNN